MIDTTRQPVSVLRRRWRRFRTLKRGWYSFVAIAVLYVVSLFNPLLINNRALVVKYEGSYYFPALGSYHSAETFGQRSAFGQPHAGEAHYRALDEQFESDGGENWVLMPLYPYGSTEPLMTDPSRPEESPHAPSAAHWLGIDMSDRDVFARLAYGFRISITFALGVVLIAYALGTAVGAILGYFGGRVDIYGQRLVEIWSGLPFLYTVIIVSSLVPRSTWVLAVLLSAFFWMRISFYVRGEFYREKSKDYVAAAIAQGESDLSIMLRHILPNALTPLISFAPFAIVAAISSLVALDFLGLGLPVPTPSWGEMVSQGLQNIDKWQLVAFPLGALFMTLMMVVFIGEAIREAFDPKVYARLR